MGPIRDSPEPYFIKVRVTPHSDFLGQSLVLPSLVACAWTSPHIQTCLLGHVEPAVTFAACRTTVFIGETLNTALDGQDGP